jgi:predicted aldo/keto reductase-like oxidoreductase
MSTVATASLKWAMQNESISTSIPGYDNFDHMNEDFSVASNLEYSEDEKKLLSDGNVTLGMGFCRQCQKCLASCPKDADIPTLMRTHMYSTKYANFHHARAVLNDIPIGKGLEGCVSCDACTARCANTVDIRKNISDLKVIYG